MKKLIRFLEQVYETKICKEFDRVVPVVADEGMGKSTLIIELTWIWQQIRDQVPDPDSVLNQIVWNDRNEFERALAHFEPRSVIAAMDAARILNKKETMDPDQVEIELDLLDVRSKEHLFLLGYQEWDLIPTMLQKRRAKHLLRIPQRGVVYGYSRETLDDKVGSDDWPDPDMRDTFPALDGKPVWEEFKEIDKEKKMSRMDVSDDDNGETRKEKINRIVDDIKSRDIENFVSIHGGNKTPYINQTIIWNEFDVNKTEAEDIKDLLDADPEVTIQHLKPA